MSQPLTASASRVLDHFLNPRNVGDLPDADGRAEVGATACGDVLRLALKVRAGRITEARFRTFGSSTAIASASAMTELLTGRTVAEALHFSSQEVLDALGGLPAAKMHCTLLAEEAVKAALADYLRRNPPAGAPGK